MAVQSDVTTVPASPVMPPIEPADFGFVADEIVPFSDAREINERRARIESPEMLRRLRSL
jgi:hypothetical protein